MCSVSTGQVHVTSDTLSAPSRPLLSPGRLGRGWHSHVCRDGGIAPLGRTGHGGHTCVDTGVVPEAPGVPERPRKGLCAVHRAKLGLTPSHRGREEGKGQVPGAGGGGGRRASLGGKQQGTTFTRKQSQRQLPHPRPGRGPPTCPAAGRRPHSSPAGGHGPVPTHFPRVHAEERGLLKAPEPLGGGPGVRTQGRGGVPVIRSYPIPAAVQVRTQPMSLPDVSPEGQTHGWLPLSAGPQGARALFGTKRRN